MWSSCVRAAKNILDSPHDGGQPTFVSSGSGWFSRECLML